jgi:outer membrane protein OmpA-like peptidoglycan-associated protein
MKRLGLLTPMVTAASILALSGVAIAQREGDARGWMGGMSHEMVASANCPQIKVTRDKITEDQARDLAQKYADKNLAGFKVVRPLGYGGGYTTVCYKVDSPTTGRYQSFYSVEYSVDAKNPAGETRNLRVDQFGYVTEFSGPFGMAGERGPAGPMGTAGPQGATGSAGAQGATGSAGAQGPAGPAGAQGPAGPAGAQGLIGPAGAQGAAAKQWASFRDFLFDFDKSDIRSNEVSKVADIAAYMEQNSSARVGIDGHSDPRGTDQYNQGLSERRVTVIRDALVEAGVPGDKIHTGAFGQSQLNCSDSTEACWQRNRRVEVLIGTDTASR